MLSFLPKTKLFFADIGDPCQLSRNQLQDSFFGFPNWWRYINRGERDAFNDCVPRPHFPGDIWAILLAVIDMLLYLAGIVAVLMLVIAGVSYIASSGNAEKTAAAKGRMVSALIGLGIVLIAILVVSFIGNSIL